MQTDAGHHLLEAWTPDGIGPGVIQGLVEVTRKVVPRYLPKNILDAQGVVGDVILGVLSARSVLPHVDKDSSPWSALLVLKAGKGHRLSAADYVPTSPTGIGRIPPTRPHFHADLSPGTVVVFNAHRLHWLKVAEDNAMLVVVAIDFDERPTRREVEGRIDEALEAHGLSRGDIVR